MRRIITELNSLGYAIEAAREHLNVSRSVAYDYSVPRISGIENPLLSSLESPIENLELTVNFEVAGKFVPFTQSRALFNELFEASGKTAYYFQNLGLIPYTAYGSQSLRANYIQAVAEASETDVKVIVTF